jgi:Glycosyltransferases involved in cell wall biogenesis
MPAAPTLSVLLVCKNPGPRLHTALASVWSQSHVAPEIVVVDGGSTDGTLAWLQQHRARLTTFVSEPDTGIYDAMNKAVAAARGDWLLFLGADDRLVGDTTLAQAMETLATTSAGVVSGEAAFDDGRIYRLAARIRPLARNFVHHQATFYRRALFDENGVFDTSLRVMGDYDFNFRLWKNGIRFKPLPLRVAACGIAGTSDGGDWRVYREEITVRHRYAPAWRCWFWDTLSVVRFLRKQLVRLKRRLFPAP